MKKWIHAAEEPSENKESVKASEGRDYEVCVSFAGLVGSEEFYTVFADSEQEAIDDAIEQAKDDLTVEDFSQVDEDEWEVEIGFASQIGVSNNYTVTADDEDEAADAALDEAGWDLEGEITHEYEEDEEE